MTRDKYTRWVSPAIFLLSLLVGWETVSYFAGIPSYVIPRPSEIANAMWLSRSLLLSNLFVTAGEAVCGLSFGTIVGCVTGLVMAWSQAARRIMLPYIVGSNAVPVVAVAPIVVLLLGHGWMSKAIVSGFLCFFPLSINLLRGLTEFSPAYSDVFRVYGATRWEFLWKFQLYNAQPYFFSGLKLSATYSVIGAVVAEFVGSDSGLGFGILHATYNVAITRLYGYVVTSILLSVTLYSGVSATELVLAGMRRMHQRSVKMHAVAHRRKCGNGS